MLSVPRFQPSRKRDVCAWEEHVSERNTTLIRTTVSQARSYYMHGAHEHAQMGSSWESFAGRASKSRPSMCIPDGNTGPLPLILDLGRQVACHRHPAPPRMGKAGAQLLSAFPRKGDLFRCLPPRDGQRLANSIIPCPRSPKTIFCPTEVKHIPFRVT